MNPQDYEPRPGGVFYNLPMHPADESEAAAVMQAPPMQPPPPAAQQSQPPQSQPQLQPQSQPPPQQQQLQLQQLQQQQLQGSAATAQQQQLQGSAAAQQHMAQMASQGLNFDGSPMQSVFYQQNEQMRHQMGMSMQQMGGQQLADGTSMSEQQMLGLVQMQNNELQMQMQMQQQYIQQSHMQQIQQQQQHQEQSRQHYTQQQEAQRHQLQQQRQIQQLQAGQKRHQQQLQQQVPPPLGSSATAAKVAAAAAAAFPRAAAVGLGGGRSAVPLAGGGPELPSGRELLSGALGALDMTDKSLSVPLTSVPLTSVPLVQTTALLAGVGLAGGTGVGLAGGAGLGLAGGGIGLGGAAIPALANNLNVGGVGMHDAPLATIGCGATLGGALPLPISTDAIFSQPTVLPPTITGLGSGLGSGLGVAGVPGMSALSGGAAAGAPTSAALAATALAATALAAAALPSAAPPIGGYPPVMMSQSLASGGIMGSMGGPTAPPIAPPLAQMLPLISQQPPADIAAGIIFGCTSLTYDECHVRHRQPNNSPLRTDAWPSPAEMEALRALLHGTLMASAWPCGLPPVWWHSHDLCFPTWWQALSMVGLPRKYLPLVRSIVAGHTLIFLFNFTDRMLHGVYVRPPPPEAPEPPEPPERPPATRSTRAPSHDLLNFPRVCACVSVGHLLRSGVHVAHRVARHGAHTQGVNRPRHGARRRRGQPLPRAVYF